LKVLPVELALCVLSRLDREYIALLEPPLVMTPDHTITHMKKIAIAGTDYVGLSNAMILAQHNEVIALDIIPEKIDMLNRRESPIEDAEISQIIRRKKCNSELNPANA
jgi:UDP-N-acetyl-D-mannosaminuronate dehydrogenase